MNFTYTDSQGQRHRVNKSTGTTDKTEALLIEAQARRDLVRVTEAVELTLSEAAYRCQEEVWGRRSDDQRQLAQVAKVINELGDIQLMDIDSKWIKRVRSFLRESGVTDVTANRYVATLRFIHRRARLHWGMELKSVVFEQTKERNGRLNTVSPEEEQQILGYFTERDRDDLSDLVVVLLETGMRLSEALGLESVNIDLRRGVIDLFPEQTKSSKPRSIPMMPRVVEVLTSRPAGFALNIFHVERQWKRCMKDLKLPYVLHELRHTAASRLVTRGVPLYDVANLLGHSSIKVTERYAHLATDTLRKSMLHGFGY